MQWRNHALFAVIKTYSRYLSYVIFVEMISFADFVVGIFVKEIKS
jgi:hypothetical protein